MDTDPLMAKALVEAEDRVYAVIGRFLTAYAAAEAAAHVVMRAISDLSDEIARVIFGGMRLSDLTWRLRRLSQNNAHAEEIDVLLTRLDLLSKERDRIAHRFVTIDGKNQLAIVSNHWNARSRPKAERDVYSLQALDAMANDCNSVMIRLMFIAEPKSKDEILSILYRDPFEPWQYTPPKRANAG